MSLGLCFGGKKKQNKTKQKIPLIISQAYSLDGVLFDTLQKITQRRALNKDSFLYFLLSLSGQSVTLVLFQICKKKKKGGGIKERKGILIFP